MNKTNEQRINNIIGQLEGLKRKLKENPKDCVSFIIQVKAAKSALSSLMTKIITEEFTYCLVDEKSNREKIEKIFKELVNK